MNRQSSLRCYAASGSSASSRLASIALLATRRNTSDGRRDLPRARLIGSSDMTRSEKHLGREDLLSLAFHNRRKGPVLTNGVGTGKTRMTPARCALACERRLEARFFTTSSLVASLRRARDEGRLDRGAAQTGKASLLVIDELGFLPLDANDARLVFQVFTDAYERQSVVTTTNLELSHRGSVATADCCSSAASRTG